MSALIISTLRDKRLEVADAIERLERQADQHRADLPHLEATMRLFDPNVEPETFQSTPPRPRNDWFRPGALLHGDFGRRVRVLRERRSRHSNKFRPAEFVHPVEGIDRNRNFGRAARVAAGFQSIADDAFIAADGGLDF